MFVRNVQLVRRRHWYIVYDITVHRVQIIPGMLRTITSLKYYFGVLAKCGSDFDTPYLNNYSLKNCDTGRIEKVFSLSLEKHQERL